MAFKIGFCCESIRSWLMALAMSETFLNALLICLYVTEIREIKQVATEFQVHEKHSLVYGFKIFTLCVVVFVTATSPLVLIADYCKSERVLKSFCGIQILYFGFGLSQLMMLTAIAVHFQGGFLSISFALHGLTVPVSLEVVNFGLTRAAEFERMNQPTFDTQASLESIGSKEDSEEAVVEQAVQLLTKLYERTSLTGESEDAFKIPD